MAAVHEAFQFLVRKFVESDEGRRSGLIVMDPAEKSATRTRKNFGSRRSSSNSITSITSTEAKNRARYYYKTTLSSTVY